MPWETTETAMPDGRTLRVESYRRESPPVLVTQDQDGIKTTHWAKPEPTPEATPENVEPESAEQP